MPDKEQLESTLKDYIKRIEDAYDMGARDCDVSYLVSDALSRGPELSEYELREYAAFLTDYALSRKYGAR